MQTSYVFPGAGFALYKDLPSFYEKNIGLLEPRLKEASQLTGYSLADYVNKGYALKGIEEQLFFYTFSAAMSDMLSRYGMKPECVAGYSMGVFSSLYAAKVIRFSDGLKMITTLNDLVSRILCDRTFSMVAVLGMNGHELKSHLSGIDTDVAVINQNTENSFILSGSSRHMTEFIDTAEKSGAMISKLPLNIPYHSKSLSAYKEEWSSYLKGFIFSNPLVPVVCSMSQQVITDAIGAYKVVEKNFYTPFSWLNTIKKIEKSGIIKFIECGPSIVLSKIGRFIDKSHKYENVKTLLLSEI